MKVLQINNFHHIRGGSDKVYFDISDLLTEKGHNVFHFSSLNPSNKNSQFEKYFVPDINFFEEHTLSSKLKAAKRYVNSRVAAGNLQKLLGDFKPDVAHLHIFQSRLSSSILPVLKKNKIPVVMHIHEYKMLCPIYKLRDNSGKVCEACCNGNYYHALTKKCNRNKLSYSALAVLEAYYTNYKFNWLKHIDHFVMVSDFIRSKHIEYLPDIEIKSSRIYNFISSEDLPKSPIKEDYFVYTGRLSAEKGVDTLLKAWAKFPELKLKILGTGDYESELKRLAKKLQLENRVEFLGFHQSDRVLREVAGAKFLVIPSEWYENNPLSVIESMAVGTPVIGSDIGGIPELVTHDRGFLYKASDEVELVQMIKAAISFSPEKYSEMSMNGRKFVAEHMNKEHFYSQLMSVYKQLFN